MKLIKISFPSVLVVALAIPLFIWLAPSVSMDQVYPQSLSWQLTNPLTEFAPWMGTRAILAHFPVREGMNILDLGCGPGRFAIPLARLVGPAGKVVAVDLQQEMLDTAQKRAAQAGISNIHFRKINLGGGEGTLERGSYDFAFMVTVLGEIPGKHRLAALKEIHEALKKQGTLSITEVETDTHYLPVDKVRAMAGAAGFKERRIVENWISYTITFEKK